MYNIKNHRLDAKIDTGNDWVTNNYLFCLRWIAESQKLYERKNAIDGHIIDIDNKIQNLIDNNKFFDIIPPLFTGMVKDTSITFLWRVDYENDYCYFNATYIGWILYRLDKLKIKDIKYQYCPEKKLLMILVYDEIVAGVMGTYFTEEEEVNNG